MNEGGQKVPIYRRNYDKAAASKTPSKFIE
jgi:hypothetical protein